MTVAVTAGSGTNIKTNVDGSGNNMGCVNIYDNTGTNPASVDSNGNLSTKNAVATTGYDGTGSATTTVSQLPSHSGVRTVIVQNDPSSTVNLKVGLTSTPALVLAPGSSMTLNVTNTNMVNVITNSGTATYNWTAGN